MKKLRFSASYLPDFASIAFVSQRVALNSSAFNRLASWGAAVSLCVYNVFLKISRIGDFMESVVFPNEKQ